MRALFGDTAGSVSVYSAMLAVLGIGGAALAVDFGRMTMLRSEMQHRADAGAMAAAVQLDRKPGARARAIDVATNAMRQYSGVASGDGELRVAAVNFYSEYEPAPVVAGSDLDARFVEVVLENKQVDFLFQPVLAILSGGGDGSSETMSAMAVAQIDPFICNATPLMMCDPAELDPTFDLSDPANIGRQVVLKPPPSAGTWAPGNFGLLALPDGSSGAADIKAALAAVTAPDCYTLDVTTAPGSKTNQVVDGLNARFDVNTLPYPAPNVINYPRDTVIDADPTLRFGDGVWDIGQYFVDKHGAAPVPPELAGASRYQVYLYELGLEFARNGLQTKIPVPDPLPGGWTHVVPPGANIPTAVNPANASDPDFDGVPQNPPASNGQSRRLVKVAVLQCVAENVQGSGTYPTNGNYVEVFVTETAQEPPDMRIFGEVRGTLTPGTSEDFHANVRLVR